ncbi:hypothetical protein SEA_MASK_95 [Mycobacterium phage Mask]|nr:hypothetical protein SEA_SEJANUS_97 [Mycobacterium phage Sejanus]UVT31624.1 hypothetical protein SEA_MASK_95 [Mycobacterium phage Mask]
MADVGDLVLSTEGGWMTLPPRRCPAGHVLVPGRVLVGHRPCAAHGGHQTWACPCGAVVAAPELDGACDAQGPAPVRAL